MPRDFLKFKTDCIVIAFCPESSSFYTEYNFSVLDHTQVRQSTPAPQASQAGDFSTWSQFSYSGALLLLPQWLCCRSMFWQPHVVGLGNVGCTRFSPVVSDKVAPNQRSQIKRYQISYRLMPVHGKELHSGSGRWIAKTGVRGYFDRSRRTWKTLMILVIIT